MPELHTTIRGRLFDGIYLRQPAAFWQLPEETRHHRFLCDLVRLSPNIPLAQRVADPFLLAFFWSTADQIDEVLHRDFPNDGYPVANVDPRHRRARWP
jgi:hypothetical protein